MNTRPVYVVACVIALLSMPRLSFGQAMAGPKPVPVSRMEIMLALEALKHRPARLPLSTGDGVSRPPAAAPSTASTSPQAGSLGIVNNGRMRSLYLPAELQTRGGYGQTSGDTELSYEFSTELFWIVSRLNNCHYCLGHQESKLKAVGVTEETLLALDTDWSTFPEKQRAAFEFTRRLTYAPHALGDDQIDALRVHFTDQQILDIAFLVGRYNSTNRWTDSLGIPQEDHRQYVSSLPAESQNLASTIATDGFPAQTVFADFAEWKAEFEKQSERVPRLALGPFPSSDDVPAHERLLVTISSAGPAYVAQIQSARTIGDLPSGLKNKIAYVAAREDHAWYMQHVSRDRLLRDGLNDETIFALLSEPASEGADSAAISFVRKLTTHPQSMTDRDIQGLQKHFSDHQIAEIVYHAGVAAILNRVTEVARLGW